MKRTTDAIIDFIPLVIILAVVGIGLITPYKSYINDLITTNSITNTPVPIITRMNNIDTNSTQIKQNIATP
jgi:hypothetical protein